METVKVGVIGVGVQGETHCKCFANIPGAELSAIADPDEEKLQRVGERLGVARRFTDYREMLALEELDAVSVVTPDHLHREPCLAVLEADKHLLVEKPLATTVEDGEAIVARARGSSRKSMINFSNRWMSYMVHSKEAVRDGKLGAPVYAYARLSNTIYVPTGMLKVWSSNTKLPFWLMSHTIDRVRWLFQSDVRRVFGMKYEGVLKAMGYDTPDLYVALVEFDNGAIGNFESCWILPNSRPTIVDSKMEIVFSHGSITIDTMETTIKIATEENYTYPSTLAMELRGKPVGFPYEALSHFIQCILEGGDPEASLEDGLCVLKVTDAIIRSAESGEAISVS